MSSLQSFPQLPKLFNPLELLVSAFPAKAEHGPRVPIHPLSPEALQRMDPVDRVVLGDRKRVDVQGVSEFMHSPVLRDVIVELQRRAEADSRATVAAMADETGMVRPKSPLPTGRYEQRQNAEFVDQARADVDFAHRHPELDGLRLTEAGAQVAELQKVPEGAQANPEAVAVAEEIVEAAYRDYIELEGAKLAAEAELFANSVQPLRVDQTPRGSI